MGPTWPNFDQFTPFTFSTPHDLDPGLILTPIRPVLTVRLDHKKPLLKRPLTIKALNKGIR